MEGVGGVISQMWVFKLYGALQGMRSKMGIWGGGATHRCGCC